jgi:hypothetical protein
MPKVLFFEEGLNHRVIGPLSHWVFGQMNERQLFRRVFSILQDCLAKGVGQAAASNHHLAILILHVMVSELEYVC